MKNNSIAIIPARGGSKRIPRKNIIDFLGKPIIAYSIEAAIQSNLFDKVMVSTDDEEIAEVAVKYGAEVPFLRSKKNADDYSGTEDVLLEVIEAYKKLNFFFDRICCIYPTAVFVTAGNLKKSMLIMEHGNFDTLFPVIRFSLPILRALKAKQGKINMVWPENENKRSQDFEPYFHDAGQFYWIETKRFLVNKKLYTENSGFIELSEMEVQDIDNLSDLEIAEFKFGLFKQKKSE
jgi:pseudaminic acid cytidylyltransferase